ncbi:MAG: hypothetical protein ACE5IO_01980 [Thermoplasmata archaeon]
MTLIVVGFVGIVLGLYFPIVANVGFYMLYGGVLLWLTALLARKDSHWSSTVHFYGEILVAFGAMTVLGAGLDMWLRIL